MGEDVGEPLAGTSQRVLVVRVTPVHREVLVQTHVLDSGHFLRQQSGDVDVVDPEVGSRPARLVQKRDEVARGEEGESGAVLRIVVAPDERPVPDAPAAALRGVTKDRHRAGGVVHAGERPAGVLVSLHQVDDSEDVDERVVVALQDELRLAAVLRDPLKSHQRLHRQVRIDVAEVALHDVAVKREFLRQQRLHGACHRLADEEDDLRERRPEEARVAPRAAHHVALVRVSRVAVHVDEETQRGRRATQIGVVHHERRLSRQQQLVDVCSVQPIHLLEQIAHVHQQLDLQLPVGARHDVLDRRRQELVERRRRRLAINEVTTVDGDAQQGVSRVHGEIESEQDGADRVRTNDSRSQRAVSRYQTAGRSHWTFEGHASCEHSCLNRVSTSSIDYRSLDSRIQTYCRLLFCYWTKKALEVRRTLERKH